MLINFIVNPVFTYGKEGWSPLDIRLSGTEESVVQWSERLVQRGHKVRVYKNGEPLTHNGVDYLTYEDYTPSDYEINVKHQGFKNPDAWYLTNETNADTLDLSMYKGVIFPTEWARHNIPVNNRVEILPHGYDPTHIYPGKKIKKTVLYASSPDRGLELLKEVWPKVVEAHPDAMLIVTYGVDDLDLPNTLCLGGVDEATMNELYQTSDIWCHPCTGGELYGMTGVKAQAAGCVPVYFPTMALQETVRYGVPTSPEGLGEDLIRVLGDEKLKGFVREELKRKRFPNWETTTDRLEEILML